VPRERRLTERFVLGQKIRFSHCDPAGILSVPRFFDLVNDAVEDWFGDGLGTPFAAFLLEHGHGNPIVATQCEFVAPVRFGEQLALELAPTRIGRSSIRMRLTGRVQGEERIRARHATSIISRRSGRSVEMPRELRERAERYLVDAEESAAIAPPGAPPPHAFRSRQLVRYSHCDPGGAVYFARLFDLFQAVLEDWFAEALGCPWSAGLRPRTLGAGAEFRVATQMGDRLDFALWVERLERGSVSVALSGSAQGEERMRVGWRLALDSAELAARMERFAASSHHAA
jgi:4-hydroxybenzoyl-CoA thioesterase